jgi:glutathione peroxidase
VVAFEVLAFPCDQFGHQEPGSDAEISAFCDRAYGVTFPLFAKIEVNGKNAHPLYVWLEQEKRGFLGRSIKCTKPAANGVRKARPKTCACTTF